MLGREFHLHSMVVHSVIALAAVAALAFALEVTGATVGPATPTTWSFLWRAALVFMLLAALPAALSGITERSHMYVNWHPGHRAKLMLSGLLLGMAAAELVAVGVAGRPVSIASWLGLAVVLGNPLVCLALSFYGLRITLGHQALARTSYVPDMFREPPVDILDSAALHVAERAKVIEVLEEVS
jgi:hypothetical protein